MIAGKISKARENVFEKISKLRLVGSKQMYLTEKYCSISSSSAKPNL